MSAPTSTSKKIVYLSCDNLDGYITDDHLTVPLLEQKGWHVETASWTAKKDWRAFDAAIIRTTWDYTEHLEEFLSALKLVSEQTLLVNCLQTVQWNCKKTYLKDLESWGLKIIPTEFSWPANWNHLFKQWNTDKIMVKPQVAASSHGTHIITPESCPTAPLFDGNPLIQPFRKRIFTDGELSFHFFNGRYSHTVRKVPQQGDYRVQEEYGGHITPVNPEKHLLDQVIHIQNTIESQLSEPSLFHRVDLVYNENNELEIMEVELVEPSLYFRTNDSAAINFVNGLVDYLDTKEQSE